MDMTRRGFLQASIATAAFDPTGSLRLAAQANSRTQDWTFLSLADLSELIRTRKISPVELTRAMLERIDRLNSNLNAYITVTADLAMKTAQQAESEIQHNRWRGPLHGIPIALKDLFDTAGIKTTAGSALFKDRVPEHDAEVVRRLKTAGAVILGKTNMHEFAFGGSSLVTAFGGVHNPWDAGRIAGGSSGGSAAAVAAGLCYGALGSDTAGSIRQPAAYCGLAGLKPTYGLVSTRGVIPLSWSLDHVGPLARTVADSALMLQAIAHYDAQDINCQKFPPVYYPSAIEESTSALRQGMPHDFWNDVDEEVRSAVDTAMKQLTSVTAGIQDVDISTDVDRTLVRAEALAYHQKYLLGHESEYHPETLRRIRSDGVITSPQYIQAHRDLMQQRRQVLHIFERVDLVVTPTTPEPAPTFAELEATPDQLRGKELIMLRNTRPFNVFGLPSVSVCCGFSKSGLPIGLQISGAPGSDGIVLGLAHAYQKQSDWHKKKPAV